jgi:serine/threonine-protein kinase
VEPLDCTSIGKYRLITMLGRGGTGYVYLASVHGPDDFDKLVVLKVLRTSLADDPDCCQMFAEEARIGARLNHPNVVHTFEVGSEGKLRFIAMEYLDGQPLSAVVRRMHEQDKAVPLAIYLRILVEALAGLHYAHELTDYDGAPLHPVHRDVTPNNVFLTYDGGIKLLDFGIAKAVGSSVRTESGMIRGTIGYMSPEQLLAEARVDRRTDVYPVGVMLWEALTGRRLWRGLRDPQIMRAVLEGDIPRPRSLDSSIPQALDDICMRAVAKDPDARYETAADLRRELEAYLDANLPRVGPRECGAFVAELFAEQRKETSRSIAVRMAERARGEPAPAPQDGGASAREPASERPSQRPQERRISTPVSTGIRHVATVMPAPSRRPRSLVRAVIAVAVVFGIGLALAERWRGPVAPAPKVTSNEVAPRSEPLDLPPVAPIAVSRSIALRFEATPREARFFVDGEPIAENPATLTRTRDDALHDVRVEARGYVAHSVRVRFDRDIDLHVPLEAAPPPRAVKAAPPPSAPPPAPSASSRVSRPPLDPTIPWQPE